MRPVASLVSLLLLAVAGPALAAKPAPAPPPAFAPAAEVRAVTLRNGVRLLLAPDPDANAVDVALWFPRREPAGLTGMAHLFEGLLSGTSAEPGEHDRRIEAEGGNAAAYTTPDLQCFQATVPAAALDEVLRLEADRIAAFGANASALERRKRDLVEERRRAEAMPLGRVSEAFQALAWSAGPYHVPVLGLEADVARIGLADCQAWHRDHLGPRDVVVTVVGAFDPERALQSARRWLEPIKARRPGAAPAAAEPAQKAERRATLSLPLPARVLVVGWRMPPHAEADGPALALLARVLATGGSSRLQAALGADPLRCVAVQGAFDTRRDGGLLYAFAMARPGSDTAAVERAAFAEAERLGREPVGADELERARRQEEMAIVTGWQTVRGRADALGQALLLDGDHDAAAARLERIRTLGPEELRAAAARWLTPANRCVLWAVPDGAASSTEGGR
jgi:zinc protease